MSYFLLLKILNLQRTVFLKTPWEDNFSPCRWLHFSVNAASATQIFKALNARCRTQPWFLDVVRERNHCSTNAPSQESTPIRLGCRHPCTWGRGGWERELLNSVGKRGWSSQRQKPKHQLCHRWHTAHGKDHPGLWNNLSFYLCFRKTIPPPH